MKLRQALVEKYKSIENSGEVDIDEKVTVLVGVNEAGKSAFLEALWKAKPVLGGVTYRDVYDYPRRELINYQNKIKAGEDSATVATLTYELNEAEIKAINDDLGMEVCTVPTFSVHHKYDNSSTISFSLPEEDYVKHRVDTSLLSEGIKSKVAGSKTIKNLVSTLEQETLTGDDAAFLESIKALFTPTNNPWSSWLSQYVWRTHIQPKIPEFLYFSDYNILPGKINLPSLQQKVNDGVELDSSLKTALSLFDMAGVAIQDLMQPNSYEESTAQLEAISNDISDKVFNYWKQNQQLEVKFEVKEDPHDEAPFNSGTNLNIRVRNTEHRVSVPFDQRSKGFVWFFSFIVWFSSVQNRIGSDKELTLLLDEPGLSLHGLAQADFLTYINDLADKHQIIYTTHSPFMIDSARMHQVRIVEDRKGKGTQVSGDLSATDRRTLFPLQAGLGYTIAQNLFIAKKNALVEGPADLIYWKYFSGVLEAQGKTAIREDIVIVPTGGLDKIATFVSLMHGNQLEMAVVHDYSGKKDQHLDTLIREKILKDRQVLNYANFRDKTATGTLKASDVEDMISEDVYLKLFSKAYSKELSGKSIKAKDLPAGDRIVLRLNAYLATNSIVLRPSGGFNHYLVASYLASHPLDSKDIDDDTLTRFETLFTDVNNLLP